MAGNTNRFYFWGHPKQNIPTRAETVRLAEMIAEVSKRISNPQLGWAPSSDFRGDVARVFQGSRAVLGTQVVGWAPVSNFTGGVSPLALKEDGVRFAILHHPDRQTFGEEAKHLNRQIIMCHTHGITPVICLGPQKGRELTDTVIIGALRIAFHGVDMKALNKVGVAFAYEAGSVSGPDFMPQIEEVTEGFRLISKIVDDDHPDLTNYMLFYSGNLTRTTLPQLKDLRERNPRFSGFLVDAPSASEEFLEIAKNWASELPELEPPIVPEPTATRKRAIVSIRTPAKTIKVIVIGGGEIGNDFIGGIRRDFHNIEVVYLDNHGTSRVDSAAKLWKDAYLSHGLFSDDITVDGDYICINAPHNPQKILYLNSTGKNTEIISNLKARNITGDICLVAVESLMKDRANLTPFIESGIAKYVITSSNTNAADVTIIPGYNQDEFNPELNKVISISSCGGEAGVLTLSPLADHYGKDAFKLITVIMLHSKTNTMFVGNKGRDPKKEEILGNIAMTTTGFEKIVAAPGFFENTMGGVMAFSSRIPTEKTSVAVMIIGLQPTHGEAVTRKKLQDIYIAACQDPQYKGIVRYEENPSGTKYYIRAKEMAHIFGPMIQVVRPNIPGIDAASHGDFYILGVPFAYGNVTGYGEQLRKTMMFMGEKMYGAKK